MGRKKTIGVRPEEEDDMSEGSTLEEKAQSTSWCSQFEFQSN